jgi:GT2 family glycosyltransferase
MVPDRGQDVTARSDGGGDIVHQSFRVGDDGQHLVAEHHVEPVSGGDEVCDGAGHEATPRRVEGAGLRDRVRRRIHADVGAHPLVRDALAEQSRSASDVEDRRASADVPQMAHEEAVPSQLLHRSEVVKTAVLVGAAPAVVGPDGGSVTSDAEGDAHIARSINDSASDPRSHLQTLTIVIPTYQRREPLAVLLAALRRELEADPSVASRVDVVVVVDGSTDGSDRLAASFPIHVPLQVVSQPNRGLAAARNAGLAVAGGDLLLYLDDDLVPEPGLLRRHLAGHADGAERVIIGPCVLPANGRSHEQFHEWWQVRLAELAAADLVSDFAQFSSANTSYPTELLRRVGGFDERFRGYGMEDYELALRLLDHAVAIRFDVDAVATHDRRHSVRSHGRLRTQEGVNTVRFARMHPGRMDEIVATNPPTVWTRRLHRAGVRRAVLMRLVWRVAVALIPIQARLDPRRRLHAFYLADAAAFGAGVASTGDRELYRRLVSG